MDYVQGEHIKIVNKKVKEMSLYIEEIYQDIKVYWESENTK